MPGVAEGAQAAAAEMAPGDNKHRVNLCQACRQEHALQLWTDSDQCSEDSVRESRGCTVQAGEPREIRVQQWEEQQEQRDDMVCQHHQLHAGHGIGLETEPHKVCRTRQ